MYRKAEIIEEIDEGSVGYGVYIVTVISPYDDLIKTKPEYFHVALRVEIKIPVITHDLTDMIENIIHILGGLLQGSGVEESPCLVNVCSRFGEHITERIGIITCKEVEAVQAVTVLNGEKPDEVKVSHDTMCNAIEIGHYFRLQAIYAYGLGDTDNQTLQAERIVAKIRSKNITQIRQNDLYKLCRCKLFKNAQEFAEVVAVLEEYGYLKSETIPGANNNPKGCTITSVLCQMCSLTP